MWNTEQLIEQDLAYMLHPVTNLQRHRSSGPLVLVKGEGVRVVDTNGRAYIDGFAGLWNVNVGHGRTELAEVARQQMAQLAFQPTFFGLATPPVIELAAKMAALLPQTHFQFTSGGAESNETAIKVARYYWAVQGKREKVKIISRRMAYHGITAGTLAATGISAYHQDFGPLAPGFIYLTSPDPYRADPGLSEAEFVVWLVAELEELIAREGADTIAALIGEPIQGPGGVIVPPAAYWQAIRPVLQQYQILLIVDEVITGFGRTGWMFGQQTFDYQGDLVSVAKGISSGYVPLGAVGVSDEIYEVISSPDRMFMHGFTYSGHPVACAVALANIAILEREQLAENARVRGEQLLAGLRRLEAHPQVGQVRGKGLMAMVELVTDKAGKQPFTATSGMGRKLQAATRGRGLIVRCTDAGLAISPPLSINPAEVDELVDIVVEGVAEVCG
jgi:4-aminobutyrate--pyruvate transaminase